MRLMIEMRISEFAARERPSISISNPDQQSAIPFSFPSARRLIRHAHDLAPVPERPARLFADRVQLRPRRKKSRPRPKQKAEGGGPCEDMANDPDFLAFIGRLRKAVAQHDVDTLAPMMTHEFRLPPRPGRRGAGRVPVLGSAESLAADSRRCSTSISCRRAISWWRRRHLPLTPISTAIAPGSPRWKGAGSSHTSSLIRRRDGAARSHRVRAAASGAVCLHRCGGGARAGQSAVCTKRFAASEPFFRGHFPGNPLVPGVILTEAAAQTAGIAAGEPGRIYHLSAIRQMKFIRAGGAGEPGGVHRVEDGRDGRPAAIPGERAALRESWWRRGVIRV